ncbi:MAG: WYL domain-containing protein [Bacteroidota bacterium]
MPAGKNAGYRYRIIDQALSNRHKRWRYDDLIEHVSEKLAEEYDIFKGISKRQFDDDLRIMRKDFPEGYGAPIIRKDGDIYYEDPDFSINNNPLNDTDIENLKEVLRLIKPFQSLPMLSELESIIGKVQGAISQHVGDEIISMDHNPDAKGLHLIEKLYRLIREGRLISAQYKSFKGESEITILLHPFLIKEYNNRWFLQGWEPGEDRFINLGLDRIINLTQVEGRPDTEKKAQLIQLQKNIVGISFVEGETPVPIRLWFSKEQAPYITTKPLHSSQELIEENETGIIITLQLVPNFELEQLILSYGERVKVFEPGIFAAKISQRIMQASKNY